MYRVKFLENLWIECDTPGEATALADALLDNNGAVRQIKHDLPQQYIEDVEDTPMSVSDDTDLEETVRVVKPTKPSKYNKGQLNEPVAGSKTYMILALLRKKHPMKFSKKQIDDVIPNGSCSSAISNLFRRRFVNRAYDGQLGCSVYFAVESKKWKAGDHQKVESVEPPPATVHKDIIPSKRPIGDSGSIEHLGQKTLDKGRFSKARDEIAVELSLDSPQTFDDLHKALKWDRSFLADALDCDRFEFAGGGYQSKKFRLT